LFGYKGSTLARHFSDIIVSIEKLQAYCLSETHPRGRHKARVFKARLGLRAEHAHRLAEALVEAVSTRSGEMVPGDSDAYGERYTLDFDMTTASGAATIRSGWIVRRGEDVLRFVSCFVL
jgi:hypothetical protein